MELQELKLIVTPRARERLLAMGSEFQIAVMQLRTPRGPMPAAVCRLGAPDESARENFTRLTSGELTVWSPNEESFIKNEVIIDLWGTGGMVLPIAMTAILIPVCEGGCDSCHSDCSARREDL